MNTPVEPRKLNAAEIAERDQDIRGRRSRLSSLPPEQRTERQRQLLDEMGMVVVDGVLKARQDKPALEILIRHAELYDAHLHVAKQLMSGGKLSIRDRELAILRIGWLSQAPMEWGSHVKIAKRNGVTAEEIEWEKEGSVAKGWSRRDRAIVRAMEELHADSMIADATWADLQEFFDDKELIELLILAGQYKTVAYYQNSLRLPLPEDNEGLLAR